MNEALQRWREDFAHEPDTAFDRLVRGIVPLGGASQLSFGEILDALFEPGDAVLDTASAAWLKQHLLGPLPENTSLHRWVSILEEYFRGIAAMELPQTGATLRHQHKRLRLWLHGFYEGPDRDPEGAYLLSLARAQDSQHFSSLWRRLILGEELSGRSYLGIGILGFRKMPAQNGHQSSGVPEGLMQALVELADKPGTGQAKWKQTMRSMFATYWRSEGFWVEHLAPLLPHYQQTSNSRDWLTALLPGIARWRPQSIDSSQKGRRHLPVPFQVSQSWVRRLKNEPQLCETPEFTDFVGQHRAYVESTGDSQALSNTFRTLSKIIGTNRSGRVIAREMAYDAFLWEPWNPRNWSNYASILCSAREHSEALRVLWTARHRFASNAFLRNQLGTVLRVTRDLVTSAGVLREAVQHFPDLAVCRNNLAQTLRAMKRSEEALVVYEKASQDFPDNAFCRTGWAETLRNLKRFDEALVVYEKASQDFPDNVVCRTGWAETLRDLKRFDEALVVYEKASQDFPDNVVCRTGWAETLRDLKRFDEALVVYEKASQDFPDNVVCRNGWAETLRDLKRFDEALVVYEKASQDFPDNVVCRTGWAETLRDLKRFDEALVVYEKASQDFPDNAFCRIGWAGTLRDLKRLDEALVVYEKASHDFPDNSNHRKGWAETLQDLERFDEAVAVYERTISDFPEQSDVKISLAKILILLEKMAQAREVYEEASNRFRNNPDIQVQLKSLALESIDALGSEGQKSAPMSTKDEGQRPKDEASDNLAISASKGVVVVGRQGMSERDGTEQINHEQESTHELGDQPQSQADSPPRVKAEMSAAELLGRAMIALWQAERAEDTALRDSLCTHATALLNVPEERIDDELLAAFVETRGLVLLASGDAREALNYFEEQIRHFGRGGWIGIQLGGERARIVLGLPSDADDTVEAPSSQSARFALHVARVIHSLSRAPQEAKVRELLKQLYPRAAEFAARAQTDAEGNRHIESGAEMLGAFMQARWFRPAGIQSVEDLDQPDRLHAVVERINVSRTDTFDVLSSAATELAQAA